MALGGGPALGPCIAPSGSRRPLRTARSLCMFPSVSTGFTPVHLTMALELLLPRTGLSHIRSGTSSTWLTVPHCVVSLGRTAACCRPGSHTQAILEIDRPQQMPAASSLLSTLNTLWVTMACISTCPQATFLSTPCVMSWLLWRGQDSRYDPRPLPRQCPHILHDSPICCVLRASDL